MYHLLKMLKIYISWHIFYMSEKMCIGLMFGSSLPPVVYRRAHVLFTLFVLFVYIVLSNTYCVVLCFSSSCVPYVASFSGLSIFFCHFGIL